MDNETDRPDPGPEGSGLMQRLNGFAKNLAIVAGIGTALSTLAGLTWNLIEDAHATRDRRIAGRVGELTSFEDFGEIVTHYRKDIGRKSAAVTRAARNRPWNCDSLLDLYGSGSALYYSQEMKEYAHVREFYEDLGLLVRYGAIDFELVYEVIIFPSDFVRETEPMSRCISENWFGRGKGIKDFSYNMDLLGKNFERKRKGEKVDFER